jgi:hypothetical protein
MNEFVWPSDFDRAESDELNRVCEFAEELYDEVERLRMQLAACGVVAMANTRETAAKQRDMHPDYMSASCQDVIRAVDREMALREERDQLKAKLSREEGQHMNTVDQRDMTEQFADRLSSGIAEALGIEIGEHSSANNPWAEAITAIEEFDIAVHDAEVIERAREYVTSIVEESDFAVDYDLALLEYGKKLRQRAKEVQS